MNVSVAFNLVPPLGCRGEAADRISEEGAEHQAHAVQGALVALGHKVALVPLGADPGEFIADLRKTRPDAVFNFCEGFWGDSRKEMHVAALLEMLEYPYTGSSPLVLGLTQDKIRTKDLLALHHLSTPPYILVEPGEHRQTGDLKFPLIVKPRSEDASLGITSESVVDDPAALQRRIDYIHTKYHQGALVEEFIDGREINVAILGNSPAQVLPLAEITFRPGLIRPIVGYEGKWIEDSEEYIGTVPVCPAPLQAEEAHRIREVALRAYRLLECRDYARVDIRLRDGIPYILEINANPDISPGAGLARAARTGGIPYRQLVDDILSMTLKRKENSNANA